jgi:hypothetical protein
MWANSALFLMVAVRYKYKVVQHKRQAPPATCFGPALAPADWSQQLSWHGQILCHGTAPSVGAPSVSPQLAPCTHAVPMAARSSTDMPRPLHLMSPRAAAGSLLTRAAAESGAYPAASAPVQITAGGGLGEYAALHHHNCRQHRRGRRHAGAVAGVGASTGRIRGQGQIVAMASGDSSDEERESAHLGTDEEMEGDGLLPAGLQHLPHEQLQAEGASDDGSSAFGREEVVEVYSRSLAWVPPSPNIPAPLR